jgi:hypothetical protein
MNAGEVAEALQLDPMKWILVSALEVQRKNACRSRMDLILFSA